MLSNSMSNFSQLWSTFFSCVLGAAVAHESNYSESVSEQLSHKLTVPALGQMPDPRHCQVAQDEPPVVPKMDFIDFTIPFY